MLLGIQILPGLKSIWQYIVYFFGDYQFNNWFFDSVFISNILIPIAFVLVIESIYKCHVKAHNGRMRKKFKELYEQFKKEQSDYNVICENSGMLQSFFRIGLTDAMFVIPFPKKWEGSLLKADFMPVVIDNTQMESNEGGLQLYENLCYHLSVNGIPESKQEEFIRKAAGDASAKFVMDIKNRSVRFNKYLYGVRSILSKEDSCTISVYETDYFTFKTITSIYNQLKNQNGQVELKRNPEFSIFYPSVPFLNSMGVGGFVIIDRGYGDELVWGYRGANCQSGEYWHFSYDETFTHDDKPKIDDPAATLVDCVRRALTEELGISNDDQEKRVLPLSQITLLDGGIIRTGKGDDRYEFEVCSFVRICLSDQYSFEDFIQGYRYAKDAELETRCLRLVKIAELDAFMQEFMDNMSPESKSLALKIQTLWNLGLLPTDKDGLQEIHQKNSFNKENQMKFN